MGALPVNPLSKAKIQNAAHVIMGGVLLYSIKEPLLRGAS